MATSMIPASLITGTLHITVAFDWGEEIDLERAEQLVPSQPQALQHRRRTPTSFAYRPAPLRVPLEPTRLELPEVGDCTATLDATVFDFAAVSFTFRVPLRHTAEQLSRLAAGLVESRPLVEKAREVGAPLYARLLPAIGSPSWSDLSEEYFTFQFDPTDSLPSPNELLCQYAAWLAGIVRLEDVALSAEEIVEALRWRISYTAQDLVVIEWSAAVVVDADCEETLLTIEFANVQLLEYRYIDRQVDESLDHAYRLIHSLARSWLPFWRLQTRPQRLLGDMRIDAVVLFERASSTLKLVGDQYLARVYRLMARRFRLDEWSANIRQSLEEAQGVYETLVNQSAAYRIELLEIIIVLLIVVEIVLAFVEP